MSVDSPVDASEHEHGHETRVMAMMQPGRCCCKLEHAACMYPNGLRSLMLPITHIPSLLPLLKFSSRHGKSGNPAS